MEESIVKIQRLSHRYGSAWAVRDIDFEISQAGVLGLLGSNGAGKSTIMNIMCGVLNQTKGEVYIKGIHLRKHPVAARKHLGFLPQNAPLLMDLTVDEYLTHCAYMRLMDRRKIPAALAKAKERCGITHFSKRLIGNLSGGYRQRVGIAQAIIHQPALVVLDEPTNGLDPNQIIEVRRLIKDIAEDHSVVFSSHILTEVQATCKYVKMIEAGRLVFADTMDAFNNYIEPGSMIITMEEPPSGEELLAVPGITGVDFIRGNTIRLSFSQSSHITERFIRLSVEKGWRLTEISLEKSTLDETFAQLSKKN